MKAKEYAKKFLENPDEREAYGELGNAMLKELIELIKVRRAKYARAIVAVVLEQNRKWKKIKELLAEKDISDAGFYGICALAIETWPMVVQELPDEEKRMAQVGLLAAMEIKEKRQEPV